MSEVRALTLALPPTAQAVRAGRRFVAAVLAEWGAAHLEDRAVLLTSELITNAVLHARTPLTLSVADLSDGWVRITVSDAVPLLPQQRPADPDAGTGRGLALLEALSARWSTGRAGRGKQISFVVGPPPARQAGSTPSPAFGGEPDEAVSPLGRYSPVGVDGGPERTVRLLGLPVELYLRSRQHHDELVRECSLLAVARPEVAAMLPDELAQLVDVLGYRYGTPAGRPDHPVEMAAAAGRHNVDLTFRVPEQAAAAAGRLGQLLAAADELSRAGDLLTLPRQAEVVAFTSWYTGEICRQLAGEPARPWTDATTG